MSENENEKPWYKSPRTIFFFIIGGFFVVGVGYPYMLYWFFLTDRIPPETLSSAQKWFLTIGAIFVFGGLPLRQLITALSTIVGRLSNSPNK